MLVDGVQAIAGQGVEHDQERCALNSHQSHFDTQVWPTCLRPVDVHWQHRRQELE
jgi:hypothetical protein